jgi:hypothetical protein
MRTTGFRNDAAFVPFLRGFVPAASGCAFGGPYLPYSTYLTHLP